VARNRQVTTSCVCLHCLLTPPPSKMRRRHLFSQALFCASLHNCKIHTVQATLQQCQRDCRSSSYTTRNIGPSRPFQAQNDMGAPLLTTRLYPYHVEANYTTLVTLEMEVELSFDDNDERPIDQSHELLDYEKTCIVEAFQNVTKQFGSDHVVIQNAIPHTLSFNNGWDMSVELQLHYGLNDDAPALSTDDWTKQYALPIILDQVEASNLDDIASTCLLSSTFHRNTNPQSAVGATFSRSNLHFWLGDTKAASDYTYELEPNVLVTPVPNPYSKYCERGCAQFFSESSVAAIVELETCRGKCASFYGTYNVSVGYSDPMEVAKLECQNGCFLALQRCQPGYFCTQPTPFGPADANGIIQLAGGQMAPCDRGEYRETSYDAVQECLLCPPGTYRDGMRGVSPNSCTKCPVDTSSPGAGSTSISNCLRCASGTFAHEEGSALCKCITPFSCPV
jgi:hypothetical protein